MQKLVKTHFWSSITAGCCFTGESWLTYVGSSCRAMCEFRKRVTVYLHAAFVRICKIVFVLDVG